MAGKTRKKGRKKLSREHRRKIRVSSFKAWEGEGSDERRAATSERFSELMRGRPKSRKHRAKIIATNRRRGPVTKATRRKMSEANRRNRQARVMARPHRCGECGLVSTTGGLASHQRSTGHTGRSAVEGG